MQAQGKYRTDFTREDLVKKVWEWKEECGNNIMELSGKGFLLQLGKYSFDIESNSWSSISLAGFVYC